MTVCIMCIAEMSFSLVLIMSLNRYIDIVNQPQ